MKLRWTCVKVILALNVAVALVLMARTVFVGSGESWRDALTLYSDALIEGRWWEFFTYMWVHADPLARPVGLGLLHIIFNMLALGMFGGWVEYHLGAKRFLLMYLIAGVVAALTLIAELWIRMDFSWLMLAVQPQGMVGASGAVVAVVAYFCCLRPEVKLWLIPIPFPITAKRALQLFFVISIAAMFVPVLSFIGHSAHLGGAVVGLLFARIYISRSTPSSSVL